MSNQISSNKMNEPSLRLREAVSMCARLMRTAWGIRPWAVIGYFAGAFLEIGSSLLAIYATAQLAGRLASYVSSGDTAGIWFWLWADIIAGALTGLGFLTMSFFKRTMYFSFVRWNVNTFLGALCRFDLETFYQAEVRNNINKVGGAYIWQLPNLVDANLDLIYGLLRFLAITVVVAQIVWWLVPLIALFLIPSLIGESRLSKMQWFVWDSKGDFRHVFWGLEYIIRQAKGQMELRSTQATGFILRKIDRMNEAFYEEQESKYRRASRLLVPTKLLEAGGTAIGAILLVKQLLAHTISLERYFFLSGALLRINGALNTIFGTLTRMQESLLFAQSYFALVDTVPQLIDAPKPKKLSGDSAPTIVLEDLSFHYPGHEQAVFENLNLTIKPGEHIALVGENGAGKSTLIKLLLRFYRPTGGRILIDGIDLQDIAIESWYAKLATLFQDFNQYPLNIAENIEIGRSSVAKDVKRLEAASKFGGVDQLLEKYPHGWDTVLDASFKKGVEPSGGQWQRVAIARAFYRNADMIILDEPTSAIDAKAEYDIFNNIFKHYKDKTALIVSHRFSTVRRADRIIVLDAGKIIEQGSHAQLMKQQGLYHELFSKQAEGYRE